MKLLSDYIFSPAMRYESHRMRITYKADEEPFLFGGFLGAAILAAHLVDTEEGDARGIALTTDEEQEALFARYEREVLHDDWGHLDAEAALLNDAFLQLRLNETELQDLIPNRRLTCLIEEMVVRYMERIVRRIFREHIWEVKPWSGPFAQWLYDAAFIETQRQRYFKADWTDIISLLALTENKNPEIEPTLFFEGEDAADIMNRYFEWLIAEYTAMRREEPGAIITSDDRQYIIEQETDYAYLEPDIKQLKTEAQQAFRRWMKEWKTFITEHLPIDNPKPMRKDIRQELFLDAILPIPKENSYSAVREYIHERSKYDKEFQKFAETRKRTLLCQQLTLMFGWDVDPNSLGKSMLRKLRYSRKSLLQ